MKKAVIKIVSVAMIAVLLFSLAGCGDKGAIKATIKDFEKACNEMNVEAAIDCIDPSISGVLKLGAGLVGGISGKDADGVFESLSSLLSSGAESLGVDGFKTLKVKVNDIAAADSSATAKVTLTYTGHSGEEKTKDATVNLKNSSEGWKISGVKFN